MSDEKTTKIKNPNSQEAASFLDACSKCGRVCGPDEKFCCECGTPLAETPEPPAQPAPSPAPAEPPVQAKADSPQEPAPSAPADAAAAHPSVVPANQPGSCQCAASQAPGAHFCVVCGSRIGASGPRYRLLCKSNGSRTGIELADRPIVVGKADDCDLVLAGDDYISRRHVKFTPSENGIQLEDLGSSNGTYLRIPQPVALEPGDEVLIGASVLRLEEVNG